MKQRINALMLILTSISFSCSANPDSDIIAHLKREKFQLELFELSMCVEEIFQVLREDSTYHRFWIKRMERVYDKRLTEYERYLHSIELNFFLNQCEQIGNKYKSEHSFLKKYIPQYQTKNLPNVAESFYNFIQYPEDIDPACLIILICFPESALNDIARDAKYLKQFNNWIEYGYDEFRDGFSQRNPAKRKINNRLIDFIIDKYSNSSHSLAQESISMLKGMRK